MEDPRPCPNGCGFVAVRAYGNLCHWCFNKAALAAASIRSLNEVAASLGQLTLSSDTPASIQFLNDIVASMRQLSVSSAENAVNEDGDGDGDDSLTVERCTKCCKRVGIVGFSCRCGNTFCPKHRLPETHECGFDYKAMGREILMRQNPLLNPDKLPGCF